MAVQRLPSLTARSLPLASPAVQLAILDGLPTGRDFDECLGNHDLDALSASGVDTLQINVGKLCNQTCRHCHVDAGPDRRESMDRDTMAACLAAIDRHAIRVVDLTGGAPELHPEFRWLLGELGARPCHVIDRCNLTVLESPSARDLPELLARHRVEVVASLPHHRALATDRQRGDGVFRKSIEALRRLNAVGYGGGRSGLRLVLVTNPVGAFLPGAQASLEREWKDSLAKEHGVTFDALYCITNMPISRYLEWLIESDNLGTYMGKLVQAFNPGTVAGLMCRTMVSVAWDGTLFDCDFNQMLELPLAGKAPRHIRDFSAEALHARPIRTHRHCFGCTAGAGSSCGGATV